jgi:hypothetical protein
VPQQTGVLLKQTQQVQPASIMQLRQSQQAWIISQHFGSPEVQVMQTPDSTISHLHMPMVKLKVQQVMPFIMTWQLHMPPCSIWQRFCTMLHAILSSQEQVILSPPWHFSTLKVQRGTIIVEGTADGVPTDGVAMPGTPIPGIPMLVRSIITVLDMPNSFPGLARVSGWFAVPAGRHGSPGGASP